MADARLNFFVNRRSFYTISFQIASQFLLLLLLNHFPNSIQ